jgi:HNH endonuclease
MDNGSGECSVDGCDRVPVARGLCRLHYTRWLRDGKPGGPELKRRPDKTSCTVDGCETVSIARGLCEMHRWRVRVHGDPGPPGRVKHRRDKAPAMPCAVDGCERLRQAASPYCHLHRERLRRTGEVGPAQPMRVRGVVRPTKEGYVRLTMPDGRRVLEHVLVMERQLGRRLVDGENVHHKNGIKSQNDPGNLELWLVMQPTGQRVTDLMEYIAEYHAAAMLDMLAGKAG